MHCYFHVDRPAIGLCKHCQRALCTECAVALDDVLACKNRHEEQVRMVLQWQRLGLRQSERTKAGYVRNAIFYCVVGMLFVGFGLAQYRFLGLQAIFFILIGGALLYAASANLWESGKHE